LDVNRGSPYRGAIRTRLSRSKGKPGTLGKAAENSQFAQPTAVGKVGSTIQGKPERDAASVAPSRPVL